jgi:hypothetical protein
MPTYSLPLHCPIQLIAPEHTVDEIAQRAPKVFTTCKTVFINEENIVFKAGVEMGFKAKLTNYRIVVAIYVCVHAIHTLKYLSNHTRKRLGERNA